MKTVSRRMYLEILNMRLAKHERGEGMVPFFETPGGYDYPRDNLEEEAIYRGISQSVMMEYRAE